MIIADDYLGVGYQGESGYQDPYLASIYNSPQPAITAPNTQTYINPQQSYQQPLTTFGGGIPPRPSFFSPMTQEEAAAIAAWDAQYGNTQTQNGYTGGLQTSYQQPYTQATTGTTSTSTAIPPRPQFFSPMSPEEMAAVAAWDAKYGGGATQGGGGGGSSPYPSYPTPGAGGGGGSGSGGGGAANGKRPLYDYTYYRYGNTGAQHLDQINKDWGVESEWNAVKNAWGKPSGV